MQVIWRLGIGLLTVSGMLSCGGDKGESEDTSEDSTLPQDSDPGDSSASDSGNASDTHETGSEVLGTPLDIRLDSDMADEGGILSIHWLDFQAWGRGEVVADSAVLETPVGSESLSVLMPDPSEDQLRRPSEDSEHQLAVYVVTVRTEDSLGSVWRGVSENWLLWSSDDLASDGVVQGWNFFSPSTAEVSVASTVQLQSNLNPIDVLTFSGVFEATTATGLRGVLIPLNENSTVTEKLPILDERLSEAWAFELNGRPPENHFYYSDEHNVDCAGELPAAYVDVDGDEVYTPEKDTIAYNACSEGDKVVAYYWELIRDVETAIQWSAAGWKPGWVLARKDSSKGLLLSEQERADLKIGTSCLPEDKEPS